MSGFSSAIAGLSSGLGQGMVSKSQGQDAQLNYEALMQKKKQAEQQSSNNQTLFDQQQRLNDLKLQQMYMKQAKDTVDFTKKSFVPLVTNFVNAYQHAQDNGGLVEKIDPQNGKVYNVPADLTDSVKDMKKALVYDPQGADWINGFLAPKYGTDKNPINDVTYDEKSHQIILTQSDGNEIPMSPLMMTHTLGLDRYMSTRELQKLNNQTLVDNERYKAWKAKADLIKANSIDNFNKVKANTEKIKQQEALKRTELAIAQANKKGQTKEQVAANLQMVNSEAYKVLNESHVTKAEVKPIVDKLLANKAYTDSLVKNQNTLYRKVNQLKYFRDKTGTLSKELNALADGAKTGSFETVNKLLLRYTGHSVDKAAYLKANSLSTRINLMVMDYLQYKSGSAFGAEELKGYQAAGGVLNFNSPDLAKSSLQGMHTYLANKLRNEIAQVPTAADRLVLSYNAGYFNNTQPSATNTNTQPSDTNTNTQPSDTNTQPSEVDNTLAKINSFTTQEELNNYAANLKKTNPALYEKIQQKLSGGQ